MSTTHERVTLTSTINDIARGWWYHQDLRNRGRHEEARALELKTAKRLRSDVAYCHQNRVPLIVHPDGAWQYETHCDVTSYEHTAGTNPLIIQMFRVAGLPIIHLGGHPAELALSTPTHNRPLTWDEFTEEANVLGARIENRNGFAPRLRRVTITNVDCFECAGEGTVEGEIFRGHVPLSVERYCPECNGSGTLASDMRDLDEIFEGMSYVDGYRLLHGTEPDTFTSYTYEVEEN